jgi:hypothetical protein
VAEAAPKISFPRGVHASLADADKRTFPTSEYVVSVHMRCRWFGGQTLSSGPIGSGPKNLKPSCALELHGISCSIASPNCSKEQ